MLALAVGACSGEAFTAESTTTTLSCEAFGDEMAVGIEEAIRLNDDGL